MTTEDKHLLVVRRRHPQSDGGVFSQTEAFSQTLTHHGKIPKITFHIKFWHGSLGNYYIQSHVLIRTAFVFEKVVLIGTSKADPAFPCRLRENDNFFVKWSL